MHRIRLDGWKAIATHINRSTRQCQRLAQSSGLPIHRIPSSRAVFAFPDELDAWLAGRPIPDTATSDADGETARLTRSGRHVMIPVATLEAVTHEHGTPSPVPSTQPPPSPPEGQTDHARNRLITKRYFTLKNLGVTGALAFVVVLALVWGIHFRHQTAWRAPGVPLSGVWTAANGGMFGKAQSVGRFSTGCLAGPGTSATVTLRSGGTRWSGGVEIFDDDLHWTFAAISPRQHEIDVQRFPAGTVTTFFAGPSVAAGKKARLTLTLTKHALEIHCNGQKLGDVHLDPWDTSSGRLVLRVGFPGDELDEATGGSCLFTSFHVSNPRKALPPTTVSEVPRAQRPTATYTLTADNIDDQIDVLLDGRRLATAGYREKIGPLEINPFLTRGKHTLTMRLFNRKWSAAYGIRLQENGTDIWNQRCGNVRSNHAACEALKTRLGMVKQLKFTFVAH